MAHVKDDDAATVQRLERVSMSGSIAKTDDDDYDMHQAQQLAAQWRNGTPEEKRLVRKLDWRILPCTWLLYLLGYLDRANIS